MNNWSLLKWAMLLSGEALIIAGFCLFGSSLPDNVYYLDLLVTSLIYVLLFTSIARPMVDLNDQTQKDVGILGLSWTTVGFYSVAAIALMIGLQHYGQEFKYQIMGQGILIFLLACGLIATRTTGSKVTEVYHQEKAKLNGLDNVRRQMRKLQDIVFETKGIPDDIRRRIDNSSEALRFLSPSNDSEATEIEQQMAETIAEIGRALPAIEINRDLISTRLNRLERLYDKRKAIARP